MIAVILFLVSVAVYFASGYLAAMTIDAPGILFYVFMSINYLSVVVGGLSLLWALWIATGLTISIH